MELFNKKIVSLEKRIDYKFKDKKLCFNAFCHSSYANESFDPDIKDNERLEFLGDSVVNLIVGDILMKHFDKMNEGTLSRIRANLVNESMLSELAKKLALGDYILLGKGEESSGGREKNSILANTFEALIASVYLDGGFEKAFHVVRKMYSSSIISAGSPDTYLDSKSRLQELSQMKYKETPVYKVVSEYGPDHEKIFEVEMTIADIRSKGKGRSKKAAEQEAAKQGLDIIDN